MIDPRLLYTFNPEVWSSLDGKRPVLIHLFEGYVDAAAVNRGLASTSGAPDGWHSSRG